MFFVVAQQILRVQLTAVVLVKLDCDLLEESLDVFDVGVVFGVCINRVVSDDHDELVDLQTEHLRDLAAYVAKRLEVRNLDLLLGLVFHVQAVDDGDGLRFHVIEPLRDGVLRQDRSDAFIPV